MNNEEVSQVGEYKIERKLASGIASELYLAKVENVFRVIKVLKPEVAKKLDEAARFEDEIVHDNIVRYEAIKFDPHYQFFFVTHYYPNRPFGPRVFSTISFNETIDLFLKVAEALRYVHSFKTIHGNLKPSNILLVRVNSHYEVMLNDFGIAYIYNEEYFKGAVLQKTFGYMSPELIGYWTAEKDTTTLPEDAAPTADVYSFGICLIEALTGKFLFEEDETRDLNTLMSAKHRKRIRLTAVNSPYGVTKIRELNDILTRCIAYDPANRPADMDEVIEALKECKTEALEV